MEAAAQGFRTKVVKDSDRLFWSVWCTRALVPTEPTISQLEKMLDDIAKPHGGYTDGWGSWSGSW